MKLSLSTLFLLTSFFAFQGYAQDASNRAHIKARTNIEALEKLEIKSRALEEQILLKEKSLQKEYKTNLKGQTINSQGFIINEQGQAINKNGQIGVPTEIDKNGNLMYGFDSNLDAAITGRTNRIWQGGSSGLDLSGDGIEIGVWESGYARRTHREFDGAGGSNRASNAGDGGSNTTHAAHTAGTLIASGVDPEARGMASGARVKNYTATGWIGEIASFAASGGILGSNSNNGTGSEGTYNRTARDVDEVFYNAPFYLHCKSAANNGNDYGVIQAGALAKNIFTVANGADVQNYTGPSSVSISGSSSFGPTNDWRIKPDIINNGVNVYSCDSGNDSDYTRLSGTSMSTPATAGTVALLQEHYENINGAYMRAATAKALLINTADEVGANDGPDFGAGWGLVNAERAAQVISNNGNSSIMDELTLSNRRTITRTINSDGRTPLAVTIAWNDPAGRTQPSSSTTPVLVNDLDIRVTGNGDTYSPWVMVPNSSFNNYTAPAQKGDNFRDNVEKIDAVVPAGTYTITVTHKGSLVNNSQDFSLIVNGIVETQSDNLEVSSISNFPATSGSQTVSVSSNVNWVVTDNRSWISVSPASGLNNGSTSVRVTANTSSLERTGVVTITGGSLTRTINVTQSGVSSNLPNIALNKSITGTGNSDGTNVVSNLVDGDPNGERTRWSVSGFPQSATVDLGSVFSIETTELECFRDRAYQYIIEVSSISQNGPYTQIVNRSNNTTPGTVSSPIIDNFSPVNARYVRITVSDASGYTGPWVSLTELRVRGESVSSSISVAGVSLNPPSISLDINDTQQLSVSVSPSNATNRAVSYSSSNSSVASVSSNGLITARSAGSATVTVTTADGSFTDSSTASVAGVPPTVFNVALNKSVTFSNQQSDNPASNLVDGNPDSRWSAQTFPQWVIVDLEDTYTINSTEVICFNDRAYQFVFEASTDGNNFTQIVDRSNNTTSGTNSSPISDSFSSVNARYVRISVSDASGYSGPWVSIEELRVFGFNASNSQSDANTVAFTNAEKIEETVWFGPNPVTSTLNISNASDYHTLRVFNILGQEVIKKTGSIEGSVDVSDLANGLYMFTLIGDNNKHYVKKIVKQ